MINNKDRTNVDELVEEIIKEEPIINNSKKDQLKALIYKLIDKIMSKKKQKFYLYKQLKGHILPLTNCAFNKNGDYFITGSYDRTCKVWETISG